MPLFGPPPSAAGSSRLQPVPEAQKTDGVVEAIGDVQQRSDRGFIASMLEDKYASCLSGRREKTDSVSLQPLFLCWLWLDGEANDMT
jgi:hypothetical protein